MVYGEEEEKVLERKALIASHLDEVLKLRDIVDGTKTLAFHLEPKVHASLLVYYEDNIKILLCFLSNIYQYYYKYMFRFFSLLTND